MQRVSWGLCGVCESASEALSESWYNMRLSRGCNTRKYINNYINTWINKQVNTSISLRGCMCISIHIYFYILGIHMSIGYRVSAVRVFGLPRSIDESSFEMGPGSLSSHPGIYL